MIDRVKPWLPQPGPQAALLICPIHEIAFGGARGGGKTDGMLGHWLAHQAECGRHAKGILFRRTYPELDEVVQRTQELFGPTGAKWLAGKYEWRFPGGARLAMRHLDDSADVQRYIGHSYTWICFEELTHWPDLRAYDAMRASLRSASGAPTWLLSTCNPGQAGHSAVKARFIDAGTPYHPIKDRHGERVFIPSRVDDNRILVKNDPGYKDRLAKSGPDWLVRAWLDGDWDIAVGAYLEGIFERERHVCEPFEIPSYWQHWRAMDWGYSRPYSIGWYAQASDGRIYRYRELYGTSGAANEGSRETAAEVAEQILEIEARERIAGVEFTRNVADASIFDRTGTEYSIAEDFRMAGVRWDPCTKGPGSRIQGAHEIVSRLKQGDFFVFPGCKNWLRTVPVIPHDDKQPDDVDTDAEDHAWDETRYSLISRRSQTQKRAPRRTPKVRPRILEAA